MTASLSEALAAQGLDETDLEANRVGRVSERQIARQADVRRGGTRGAWLIAVFLIVGCGVGGGLGYAKSGDVGILIFMTIFGLVGAAIPLGIYYAFRFADPAKVGAAAVTRIDRAEVSGFLPAPNRGVYAIGLNGTRYSGFASALSRSHLGDRVNAYVVAEHRIVVALEPAD